MSEYSESEMKTMLESFRAADAPLEAKNSFAAPPLLEPATTAPRTMRCWRDGRWHADELANLAAKLERENAELEMTINTLHGLCVSAEKQAFQKRKEEEAAAGSNNDALCDGGPQSVESK